CQIIELNIELKDSLREKIKTYIKEFEQ
ncbi:hypothetical protein ACMU9M_001664, partial [Campylobacter jejuni]